MYIYIVVTHQMYFITNLRYKDSMNCLSSFYSSNRYSVFMHLLDLSKVSYARSRIAISVVSIIKYNYHQMWKILHINSNNHFIQSAVYHVLIYLQTDKLINWLSGGWSAAVDTMWAQSIMTRSVLNINII